MNRRIRAVGTHRGRRTIGLPSPVAHGQRRNGNEWFKVFELGLQADVDVDPLSMHPSRWFL